MAKNGEHPEQHHTRVLAIENEIDAQQAGAIIMKHVGRITVKSLTIIPLPHRGAADFSIFEAAEHLPFTVISKYGTKHVVLVNSTMQFWPTGFLYLSTTS